MAKTTYSLAKSKNNLGEAQIIIRMYVRMGYFVRIKSNIWNNEKRWGKKNNITIPTIPGEEQTALLNKKELLRQLTLYVEEAILNADDKNIIDKIWAEKIVARFYKKSKEPKNKSEKTPADNFFSLFDGYIKKRKFSEARIKHLSVLRRCLQRFEMYKQLGNRRYKLDIAKLTHEDLSEIEHFLFHEREFFLQYPQIYEAVPYSLKVPKKSVRKVKPYLDATGNPRPKGMPVVRGQNTVTDIMTRFRSFMIWAIEEGYAQKNPFKEYRINESVYGKPIYISVAERKKIHETDMSDDPVLEQQKNVFVLQSLIGCRVGDYYNMTYDNLIGNAIEYIPSKTRNDRVNTIRVPLTETALEIINRYRNLERKTIMPFVAQQTYNVYIKKVFLRAGITRTVTVINQQTRQEEQRPIYEIASSHMARRTFIGNIYKNVKDPNLVGALSGHKEGSKAFARYRDIDEDMKKELVNMLE